MLLVTATCLKMVEKKRKSKGEITQSHKKDGDFKNKRRKLSFSTKNKEQANGNKRRGPRLPNVLRKEIDRVNPNMDRSSDGDEDIESDDEFGNDVYEYEDDIPEEESNKNKRFDPVENYQYELPEDFEDYKVLSDESEDEEDEDNHKEDEGRHARMLEGITGLPSDAFGGKKKKDFVISEAYPESEFNPSSDILDGGGRISIQDLLEPIHGKPGFNKLRKSLRRMEKSSMPVLAPLPKPDQDRLERKAAYEHSKKDITKWEPYVKRNREAPTLYFDVDTDLRPPTIGAIAAAFKPRTDFEKKMASLVNQSEIVEAHKKDGARLLELNKISVEQEGDRQERLTKMRSLLFRHEMKAKRIKKIKSKTYHRLLKKDRIKAAEAAFHMDDEAAKELAMKQEFKRAEERMTQKHKNSSRWAKRVLQRGLDVQDPATREAFGEQLNEYARRTRKTNPVKESSSSDDSSDDYDSDDMSAGSDLEKKSKLLMKAKEKTLKALEEDEELPKSGVLSLPFMERGLKKKKEAADEEAKLALEEYESSLNRMEDKSASGSHDKGALSGRRVFGAPKKVVNKTSKIINSDNFYDNSDSENDDEVMEDNVTDHNQNDKSLREADIDPDVLREALGINHSSVFKSIENAEDSEPKTTYEVAYLSSDSWKRIRKSSDATKQTEDNNNIQQSKLTVELKEHDHIVEENNEDGDEDDIDGQMVDGILSSGPKSTYELPSEAEIRQRAFAGDDVEEDFEKDKAAVLDEENPEPEKPGVVPGWGQWTDIQKKRGAPSWMVQEHEMAKKKRDEALKKRKDAELTKVIISEKLDKKAEKLYTKTLPYPFTSKEVFEQSMRMPIGPEFNPATAIGALNRPEVVKRPGIIIKPCQDEDRIIYERSESRKRNNKKQERRGNQKTRS